jgi:hypothetical protein
MKPEVNVVEPGIGSVPADPEGFGAKLVTLAVVVEIYEPTKYTLLPESHATPKPCDAALPPIYADPKYVPELFHLAINPACPPALAGIVPAVPDGGLPKFLTVPATFAPINPHAYTLLPESHAPHTHWSDIVI